MSHQHTDPSDTRFYAFYTWRLWVSNGKPQYGDANFTRFTDFTPNRRGCTWRASASARACSDTPLSVGVKSVKSVKSPAPSVDYDLTFGVKPGVNLTPAPRSGVSE